MDAVAVMVEALVAVAVIEMVVERQLMALD